MAHPQLEGRQRHPVDVADTEDSNLLQALPAAVAFVAAALGGSSADSTAAAGASGSSSNKRVLVHCAQGVSRSTAVVLAYLMARTPALEPEAALAALRQRYPAAAPNPGGRAGFTAAAVRDCCCHLCGSLRRSCGVIAVGGTCGCSGCSNGASRFAAGRSTGWKRCPAAAAVLRLPPARALPPRQPFLAPALQPLPGFMRQLELFFAMGCRLAEGYLPYKRFLLEQARGGRGEGMQAPGVAGWASCLLLAGTNTFFLAQQGPPCHACVHLFAKTCSSH